jgi:hypothetical protein
MRVRWALKQWLNMPASNSRVRQVSLARGHMAEIS